MAQKKISELNAATTLAGTEVLPVVQSAATVKATVNQVLANLSASNLTSGTVPLARLSGITSNADKALVTDGTDVSWGYPEGCFVIACSDETTNIATGAAKVTFRAPFAFEIPRIPRASLSTASTSGLPEVNIKVAGTTIFSTKLTIDANEKTSTTAATVAVLTTTPTSVSDDAEITIDIDTAGTGAKGLKVYMYYRRS